MSFFVEKPKIAEKSIKYPIILAKLHGYAPLIKKKRG